MFVSAKNTQPQGDLPLHCSFARSDWVILAGFWHPVATSGEVADAPVRVLLLDMPVVLFRTPDGVKAAKDVCMHRGGQLSLGSVCDGLLVCGFHGFEYNGEGTCVGIPALAKGSPIPKKLRLRNFQCRERYGLIWVCLADQARAEMPHWPQIEDGSGTVIRIPSYEIKASAGRRVENYNDIAHVPFLHRNSFGWPPTDIAPYDVISGDNTLSFKVDILEQTRYSGEFGGQLRQYSLLNNERETDRYVISVLREEAGRGGSRSMHGGVAEGSALRIGAPRNAFPLEESAAPVVLLAGGIGVTPILAMARSLNARGKPFGLHFANPIGRADAVSGRGSERPLQGARPALSRRQSRDEVRYRPLRRPAGGGDASLSLRSGRLHGSGFGGIGGATRYRPPPRIFHRARQRTGRGRALHAGAGAIRDRACGCRGAEYPGGAASPRDRLRHQLRGRHLRHMPDQGPGGRDRASGPFPVGGRKGFGRPDADLRLAREGQCAAGP